MINLMLFQVDGIGLGAGHGAPGGSNLADITGGLSYDNTRLPVEPGSGGGNSLNGTGGAGGGYLKLTLFTSLTVFGKWSCF
jgi:hypothetical protein